MGEALITRRGGSGGGGLPDTICRSTYRRIEDIETGNWKSLSAGGTFSCEWGAYQLKDGQYYDFLYDNLAWVLIRPMIAWGGYYPVIIIPRDSEAEVRAVFNSREAILKGRIVKLDTKDLMGYDWKLQLDVEMVAGSMTFYYDIPDLAVVATAH
jgi:hypothetical protein